MPKLDLYNMSGKVVGDIELNDNIFGVEINQNAMHSVVVAYLANQRQGTQSAKTRSEVRGGGAKPFRQKGTGRARQGTIRAPHHEGGGVVFAPKPRSYRQKMNKKFKRVALKSALSSKVLDNNMFVIDELNFNEINTKKMVNLLKGLNIDKKALVVLDQKDDKIIKSTNNIPGVVTTLVSTLNVYDVLKYDYLITTKDGVNKIEEVYK